MAELDYLDELLFKKRLPEINLADEAVQKVREMKAAAATPPVVAPRPRPAAPVNDGGIDLKKIESQAIYQAALQAKQKAAVDKIRAMSEKPAPTPTPSPSPTPKPIDSFVDADGNVVQRQDTNVIESDPLSRTDWIQDKPTDPRSLSQNRESYNMIGDNLGKTIEKQDALVGRAEMARKPYTDRLNQMVDTYMQPVPTFKSSYDEYAKKMLSEEAADNKVRRPDFQPPQRQEEDLLTKAIYALGPAAGAMMLGEDAALAAPTAQKQAYALRASDIAQKNKEYDQELAAYRANATREKNRDSNNSLRGMALKLLSEGEREDFNRQQDSQDKRMGEATKILSGLSADESKRLDAAIQDRHELIKDQYSKGLISVEKYQNDIYRLQALQNQKDIAQANLAAADKRFTTEEAGRNQRAKESNETTLKATQTRGDAQANVARIGADQRAQSAKLNADTRKSISNKKGAGSGSKSFEAKLAGLKGGDKARFDSALMGLKAVDQMSTALEGGDNTFSLIGDNDFTIAKRNANEAFGRMQSGGAIQKDEEERFDKTNPGWTDSKVIQRFKLSHQREEFLSRLNTLGFSPEEIAEARAKMKKSVGTQSPSVDPKNMTREEKIRILKSRGHQ